MPRVIISSGHSSKNPGTIANGLREVDVARKISKAILPYLRQNGVITLSVPPEMELQERIDWINKSGYDEAADDIAIEIHINDGGESGIEGWFEANGGNKSQQLTDEILKAAAAETGLQNQGGKSEYEHELGSLAFLHDTNPIASLLECGYIDNDADAKFLKDDSKINLLGKGIAKGILKYLNIEYKEVRPAPAPVIAPRPAPAPAPQPVPRPAPAMMPPSDFDFDNPYMGAPASPAPYGGNPNTYRAPAQLPSREDRKDMISKNYVKILGREPNQSDLNYFLNIGITEDQLLKKMIESQEHADLVKARQEVLKIKQKFHDQQTELLSLRAGVTDQQKIIENLQASIAQKNGLLNQYQQKQNQIYQMRGAATPVAKSSSPKYKGSFLDRLFRAFSDVFA